MLPTKKQFTVLTRNEPTFSGASGGNPAKGSNSRLMTYIGNPQRYAGGLEVSEKIAEEITVQATCLRFEKLCGEEREPEVDDHASSPSDKMRPRTEVICYTPEGVYAIDKGDYILFPGGGVDDGEQPRDAAIRETIEESNRHPVNITNAGVVESVWPVDSGNEFWDESKFDGERTYFFIGMDAGDAGITHDDQEEFKVVPFEDMKKRLSELIDDKEQAWAKRNNEERLRLVGEAQKLASNSKPIKQAEYYDPTVKKKKKKKKTDWMGGVGLGLAAAGGLGALGTRAYPDWFLSESEQAAINDYLEAAKSWRGTNMDPRLALRGYTTAASRAARVSPFGAPMVNFMKVVRSIPYITKHPWQPGISEPHYEEFAKGPASAYLKRVSEYENLENFAYDGGGYSKMVDPGFSFEKAPETALPVDLRTPEGRQFAQQQLVKLRSDVGEMPAELPKGITAALQQMAVSKAQSEGFGQVKTTEGLAALTPDEQSKVMDNFDEYVKTNNPTLWKQKQVAEFDLGLHGIDRGDSYSAPGSAVMKTWDAIKKYSPYALGVGGALLAGHLLSKLFNKDEDEEEDQVKQAQADNVEQLIPKDPNAQFVDQLAARIQSQIQQPAAPQPTVPQEQVSEPPGALSEPITPPAEQVANKIAESLDSIVDIADPEDRKELMDDVAADAHGTPQAKDVIQFAQNDVQEKVAEVLAGGLASGHTVEEIAKKHGVDVSVIEEQLKLGIEVEKEHTPSEDVAREIALDHLWEMADYYTRLKNMESEAEDDQKEEDEGPAPSKEQRTQIMRYIMSTEDIDDEKMHALFEKLGINPHAGEKAVYEELQRLANHDKQTKTADTVSLIPRQDRILFLPDGRIVVRRSENRRFKLPMEGPGKKAPYENDVLFLPEGGIPQEGYHGFRITPYVGEVEQPPEGFEALPPEDVLRDMYASMGMSVNKPFRQLDRTRARVINRWLKRRKQKKEERKTFDASVFQGL